MKELRDILAARRAAQAQGETAALVTVVRVEGSSYRRPGARMLVREDGSLTGAISGGCLEGDALAKARLAMRQGRNRLVTYDSTDEDDLSFGIQLGCRGIVHLLFEPLPPGHPHPIDGLEAIFAARCDAVLITLFDVHSSESPPGTQFLFDGETVLTALAVPGYDMRLAKQHAMQALREDASFFASAGPLTAFVERIRPPIALVIAGAGNDAQPLCRMALALGWEVTVADGRPASVTAARFPGARCLHVRPDALLDQIACDTRTAIVAMTHNYHYDRDVLRDALGRPCFYLGLLGPKEKRERMLAELSAEGVSCGEDALSRLHGPTGLDLGAETAEEIALAILAEMQAVLSGASGQPLRERGVPIHRRPA